MPRMLTSCVNLVKFKAIKKEVEQLPRGSEGYIAAETMNVIMMHGIDAANPSTITFFFFEKQYNYSKEATKGYWVQLIV